MGAETSKQESKTRVDALGCVDCFSNNHMKDLRNEPAVDSEATDALLKDMGWSIIIVQDAKGIGSYPFQRLYTAPDGTCFQSEWTYFLAVLLMYFDRPGECSDISGNSIRGKQRIFRSLGSLIMQLSRWPALQCSTAARGSNTGGGAADSEAE
eukprot:767734-Hanusia_phi.AAC.2